jgi:alanine racemase
VSDAEARAGAILTIDLAAIAGNWRWLRDLVAPAACAAVVKANAYGLGADRVAPALRRAGCTTFFVATIDEGIALRRVLAADPGEPAAIYVLNGLAPGTEGDFLAHALVPVLNCPGQTAAWTAEARRRARRLPAALHVDTGMARLGFPASELERLKADPHRLDGLEPVLAMSHLACADEPDHPMNDRQRRAFTAAFAEVPVAARSLANSSAIFLGADYHFDLSRPGAALYGVAPCADRPNPMSQVVRLQGRIVQVREIDHPASVGYGASYRARSRERIATVAVGYADGYSRALSNRGSGFVGETRVPLVGRVSMDLVTFDVTRLAEVDAQPGKMIDLIGPAYPVDAVAADAGTIGYEVLTALGGRYCRRYVLDGAEGRR